ncbi:hypothetical protein E8E14_008755 [Neopestalotiopsis sp. 37M]|nr:hypothetical protein E8E14_008755 [Neopestalotiopsis sp. 37M]
MSSSKRVSWGSSVVDKDKTTAHQNSRRDKEGNPKTYEHRPHMDIVKHIEQDLRSQSGRAHGQEVAVQSTSNEMARKAEQAQKSAQQSSAARAFDSDDDSSFIPNIRR